MKDREQVQPVKPQDSAGLITQHSNEILILPLSRERKFVRAVFVHDSMHPCSRGKHHAAAECRVINNSFL